MTILVIAFLIYTIAITTSGYSSRVELEKRVEILERAQHEQLIINARILRTDEDLIKISRTLVDLLKEKVN
jgi:hypothetical protein